MARLCTNFNNKILDEMEKLVAACNENGFVIQEIKFINDSVGKCQLINSMDTDGLLSFDLKVVMK